MANSIGFNTSLPIEKLPEHLKTKIWNMRDNKFYEIELLRYEQNMRQDAKLRNKKQNPVYSDWARFNYRLEDYQGEKRVMFHVKTAEIIEVMTVELFDEIVKRNGPESNLKKMPNGETFALWKLYITSQKSVKAMKEVISKNPAMEEIIERKVAEQLEKVMSRANKQTIEKSEPKTETKPVELTTHTKPEPETEIEEKDSVVDQVQPMKKRGKKKK